MPININGANSYAPSVSNRDSIASSLERISSGLRINSAKDDAAGLAIASQFSKEINGLTVSARNAGDGISLTQTADGSLSSVTENLQRIRDLALQSANGTLTDLDRRALNQEAQQLQEQNASILENSNFNGVALFTGDNTLDFQVGPDAGDTITIDENDLFQDLQDLGLNTIDIGTQSGASDAIGVIDDSLDLISEDRSEYGAVANRFESTIDNLDTERVNAEESRSRLADADLAKELSDIAAGLVQEKAGIAVQSQANANSGLVLQLLR